MNQHVSFRVCKKCGHTRPLFEFPIYNKETGARRHECGTCYRSRDNERYLRYKDDRKRQAARRYAAHPWREWNEERKERQRETHRRVRAEHSMLVLEHYGAKCACCGETEPMFLTIDHINNNGADHRREIKARASPGALYRWIVKNNFPDDLQLLCYNCNCGRHRNGGKCPHKHHGRSNDYPYHGSRAKRPEALGAPNGAMI